MRPRLFASRTRTEPLFILCWMVLAIGSVAGLAAWSEERESVHVLHDFAREQALLAESLATALREGMQHDAGAVAYPERLLANLRHIERPHGMRVLLAVPGVAGLTASNGSRLNVQGLERAVRNGSDSLLLSHQEAQLLGLPPRMAVAGLSRTKTGAGPVTILVVASAQSERDREVRARWRLLSGIVVVSGIVFAFGGFALRKQRKQLELAHQLALTTLQTERDERLVRADKLATMGALATGIAHEVSTPLGVILGRAEQLLPKQPDEKSRRAVQAIAAQTERIHTVVRGFLALARGVQPALEHCEPAGLARAALDLVEHRFEKAHVLLMTDFATGLPKVACAPRLFEQVLVNLLLNACDACEHADSVTLAVQSDDTHVEFVVTDDGVGIRPDAAERVTESFFTTKAEGMGTGLGLAIANEIVKHHRGTLKLASRSDGRGTRASVALPAVTNHGVV